MCLHAGCPVGELTPRTVARIGPYRFFFFFGNEELGAAARPRSARPGAGEVQLRLVLADGGRVSVPLAWFPRLLHASAAQLENYELLGEGVGIHWPDLDEDLSVSGLLRAGGE
jgi:hypothetical protein